MTPLDVLLLALVLFGAIVLVGLAQAVHWRLWGERKFLAKRGINANKRGRY